MKKNPKKALICLLLLTVIALTALAVRHPFMALIWYPEETVAWHVQEGDAAFLLDALRSSILPRRVRRAALYGVIDLRPTVRLSDEEAHRFAVEFSRDVPGQALIMLYPPFVNGSINSRLRAVLADASADGNTRFAAFTSLTEKAQDRIAHANQITSLLETVRPEPTHTMLNGMWLKLQN